MQPSAEIIFARTSSKDGDPETNQDRIGVLGELCAVLDGVGGSFPPQTLTKAVMDTLEKTRGVGEWLDHVPALPEPKGLNARRFFEDPPASTCLWWWVEGARLVVRNVGDGALALWTLPLNQEQPIEGRWLVQPSHKRGVSDYLTYDPYQEQVVIKGVVGSFKTELDFERNRYLVMGGTDGFVELFDSYFGDIPVQVELQDEKWWSELFETIVNQSRHRSSSDEQHDDISVVVQQLAAPSQTG